MTEQTTWCIATEITNMLGISYDRLYYAKIKGRLKNIKFSDGTNDKGGRTYYDLDEVKRVIPILNYVKLRKT